MSALMVELADERTPVAGSEHVGRQHSLRRRVILHAVTITLALLAMFPFIWTLASSLKTPAELVLFPPPLLPYTPQWGNYLELWRVVPFGTWLLNSLIFTIVGTIGAVASATLVAYSFARFRYPGRDVFFLITLATIMLPVEVTIIPQYLLFFNIGWIDTLLPLIVPQWLGGGAFNIFLIRQFIMSLPRDLDEAALVDGASYLQTLWYVLLPLCIPALATAAIITAIANWDAFLGPFIFLNSKDNLVLAVGIREFQSVGSATGGAVVGGLRRDHLLMAAATLMTLPVIGLFFVCQRYFVRGAVMSGIKG
ncbi:MAG: carbohydrate ABC transporter permease [Chloroflexi bacterium]|nr:carbohydrate ABC transporter permease [Chloroflexota bacterium]